MVRLLICVIFVISCSMPVFADLSYPERVKAEHAPHVFIINKLISLKAAETEYEALKQSGGIITPDVLKETEKLVRFADKLINEANRKLPKDITPLKREDVMNKETIQIVNAIEGRSIFAVIYSKAIISEIERAYKEKYPEVSGVSFSRVNLHGIVFWFLALVLLGLLLIYFSPRFMSANLLRVGVVFIFLGALFAVTGFIFQHFI